MKNSKEGSIIPLLILVVLLVLSVVVYMFLPGYVPTRERNVEKEFENVTRSFGEVTLKVGEASRFDRFSLGLKSVSNDSRCPKGVNCVWAGTINAEVALTFGESVRTTTLSLGQTITEGEISVKFVSASPYPEEGRSILPKDYRLIFEVTKK